MDCVPWIWRFIVTTIGRFLIKNLKVARNKQVRQLWVFMFSFSTVLNITIYNCHRWHFSERVTRPIFHNDCVHARFHRCDRSSTCACFWSMQPVDSLSGTSTDLGGKGKKKSKAYFYQVQGGRVFKGRFVISDVDRLPWMTIRSPRMKPMVQKEHFYTSKESNCGKLLNYCASVKNCSVFVLH